jgi:hypothetical protein
LILITIALDGVHAGLAHGVIIARFFDGACANLHGAGSLADATTVLEESMGVVQSSTRED